MAGNDHFPGRIDKILEEKQNLDEEIKNFYNDLVQAANHQQPAAIQIKQGQHVINKDILRLQSHIIDTFVADRFPDIRSIIMESPNSSIIIKQARESSNYFEKNVQEAIADDMKAYISAQNYIDRNALVYKEFIKLLRKAALKYMKCLNEEDNSQSSRYKTVLRKTCSIMNQKEIYVDQDALKDWLQNQGGNQNVYRRAKDCVEKMLLKLEDNIPNWLGELNRIRDENQP